MATDNKPNGNTLKIVQEEEKSIQARSKWTPSKKEEQTLTDLRGLFQQDKDSRETDVKRHFNERTLEDYLDDNQKRVNGYVEPRADADDWQTRYRSLMTRNKMIAFLSKVATIVMKMRFRDKHGGGDETKLRIFNAHYKHTQKRDNEQLKQFRQMWHKWMDGTVIVWDTPKQKTKKIKKVTEFDPETMEAQTVEKVLQTFYHESRIIPLQDVWFGDLREPDVKKQPHLWLRLEPTYQAFLDDYGKIKNAKFVMPSSTDDDDINVFYREDEMNGKKKVEVLYYMNIWEDRMVIMANSVILYDGPLPWGDDETDGKHYPVVLGINEMIAADFIYGKSGADNLKSDQDLMDLFFRKLADRTILTTDPPILTQGNPDLPESLSMKPGRQLEVDNLQGIREFAYSSNAGEIVQALGIFKDQADRTSLSDASSGVSQPNRTATADMIAEQATKQIVGLSQFFDQRFAEEKAILRAQHILQFIDIPEKTVVDGEDEEIKFEYGVFTEKNTILDDGSRGDRIYQLVASAEELPRQKIIDIREAVAQKHGYNVQYTYLTTDYFDDLITEVEAVPTSSTEQSPALKRSVEQAFLEGYANYFPELFQANQEQHAKDYIESFEKDVDQLLSQKAQTPVLPEGMGGATASQPAPGASRPGLIGGKQSGEGVSAELQRMSI